MHGSKQILGAIARIQYSQLVSEDGYHTDEVGGAEASTTTARQANQADHLTILPTFNAEAVLEVVLPLPGIACHLW